MLFKGVVTPSEKLSPGDLFKLRKITVGVRVVTVFRFTD